MNGTTHQPLIPDLSAIVVTPDRYETVRETMDHLRAQSVQQMIEVVIVAPSISGLELPEQDLGFHSLQVIEVGPVESMSEARAAGIRSATAAVIVLTEDHAFPQPGWAEALIESHRGEWAAVGPAMSNANPRTVASRAQFIIEYGRWMEPAESASMDDLPANHASYKRDILLEYGDRLEHVISAGTHLHWDLLENGHQLLFQPRARVRHLNMTRLSSWVRVQFWYGRMFAGHRFAAGSFARRALYAGGAPLIPLVRFLRLARRLVAGRPPGHAGPLVLLAAAFGLGVNAMGEFVGYALGTGPAVLQVAELETHREDHM